MQENNWATSESEISEREIDENLEESFPASDAPSWTLGTNHGKNLSKPGADTKETVEEN